MVLFSKDMKDPDCLCFISSVISNFYVKKLKEPAESAIGTSLPLPQLFSPVVTSRTSGLILYKSIQPQITHVWSLTLPFCFLFSDATNLLLGSCVRDQHRHRHRVALRSVYGSDLLRSLNLLLHQVRFVWKTFTGFTPVMRFTFGTYISLIPKGGFSCEVRAAACIWTVLIVRGLYCLF